VMHWKWYAPAKYVDDFHGNLKTATMPLPNRILGIIIICH
jgi:hypothetical protein